MTIKGFQFDRETPTPLSDSRLYDWLSLGRNGVVSGIGDGMVVTVSGLVATIATGACVIKGRLIEFTAPHNVTIPLGAASPSYLVVAVDLAQINASTGTPGTGEYIAINNQVRAEVVSSIVQEDINNGGSIYMLPLGTLANSGGWSFVQDPETYDDSSVVSISKGGTGASTVEEARESLGITTTNMMLAETATGRLFRGKPTYVRGFEGTITATFDISASTTVISLYDIDVIVSFGGSFDQGNGTYLTAIPGANIHAISGSGRIIWQSSSVEYNYSNGAVVLKTLSNSTRTNAPYYLWIEYTKV